MFSRLTSIVTDVVTSPVTVVADVVTFGGLLNDRSEPYTATKLKRIGRDTAKVVDDIAS